MKMPLTVPGLLICCLLAACGGGTDKKIDTPTSGTINIVADETFSPIIAAEAEVFQVLYNRTKLNISYLPEVDAIRALLNDSARMIVTSRDFTENEKAIFKQQKITPRATHIATDAIALIVNRANADSLLLLDQVKALIKGEITTWKQLGNNNSLGEIVIVFDNKNSGTVRYMKELSGVSELNSKNTFASKSNPEVIEYVRKNKNAVGIIGVNWISDRDDTVAHDFLQTIRVVGIASSKTDAEKGDYYQPYQAYMARGYYPLTRKLYVLSREARTGLATGFTTFIASDRGQRIILKSGLLPATAPVRIVEIKNENLFQEDKK